MKVIHYAEIRVFHDVSIMSGNLITHSFVDVSNEWQSQLVLCSCWPWILCLKAHFLSVCMYVMVFQDKHTLPKWNILSLLCTSKQLDRIFQFVRVCLSWKTITCIWTERKWAFRHSIQGQYKQRTSKETWHSISWKTFSGPPSRSIRMYH